MGFAGALLRCRTRREGGFFLARMVKIPGTWAARDGVRAAYSDKAPRRLPLIAQARTGRKRRDVR